MIVDLSRVQNHQVLEHRIMVLDHKSRQKSLKKPTDVLTSFNQTLRKSLSSALIQHFMDYSLFYILIYLKKKKFLSRSSNFRIVWKFHQHVVDIFFN